MATPSHSLYPLHSIRARVTAAFSIAVGVLLFLTVVVLSLYSWNEANRGARDLLQVAARKVRRELSREPLLQEGQLPPGELRELIEDERDLSNEEVALMVADGAGRVVRSSSGRLPPWPRPQGGAGDGWRTTNVVIGGGNQIVIGLPWQRTEDALRRQTWLLATLATVFWAAASGGAWLLVGQTLSPIDRLSRQASVAATDNLDVRLDAPSRDDEIVALVATLNDLLRRLSETVKMRERFYAAASHELRTPLQALSGHLELALTRPRTATEYQTVVAEASGQTARLITLIRDLLRLNQIDNDSRPPREPVCLVSVTERILRQMESDARRRGLRVERDFPPAFQMEAAPTHVEMLVRNLLENAIKYADENGVVRVEIAALPSGAGDNTPVLRVFNECAPVAGWDEEKLFEPFYRPDASRNSQTGGNGLGLALVRALARANGWSVRLRQVGSAEGGTGGRVGVLAEALMLYEVAT